MGAQLEASGLSVLRAVYGEVLGIRDYVHGLQCGEHRVSLQREGDTADYNTFLSHLLVCLPPQAKKLPDLLCFQQLSTQSEVVTRVIQRICEKNEKNVLAFGYGPLAPNIQNYFPNPTTTTIISSVLWETLLSRVGDDVMMHLLEHCSLFMKVPPNCFYQMCGPPIYNVTKDEAMPSPWLKRSSLYKGNVLSHYIQTYSFTSNPCSLKINTLREKMKSQRNGKPKARTAVMLEAEVIPPSNAPLQHLGHISKFNTANGPSKRPPCIDLCNTPAKRPKTEIHPTDTHTSNVTTEAQSAEAGVGTVWPWSNPCQPDKHPIQKKTLGGAAENCSVSDFVESRNVSSCNLISTSQPTSPSNIFIEFSKVLDTDPISKEGFPQSFILNMLKSNSRGSLSLIERIFMNNNVFEQGSPLQEPTESKRKKKVCKRYWQLRPIFQELIENHKFCCYMSLLKKHCPVKLAAENKILPRSNDDGTSDRKLLRVQCDGSNTTKADPKSASTIVQSLNDAETAANQSNVCPEEPSALLVDESRALLRQHHSDWKVYTFIRECLHIVVPAALWGSSHNKCRFLRNVKMMIIKSSKCEKISLSELMCKMKVEDCSWLRLNKRRHFVPASEHLLREKIFSKFLFWLMDTYIMELLKAFYYITEASFQKNKLFFYRKSIWEQLQKIGIRKHMTNVKLRLIPTDEMENMQQQKNTPIISRLRFIPKRNGLRPIVKMCDTLVEQQSKEIKQRKIQHFNTQVRNLLSVLNYKRKKFPNLIGSSVFGLDGIYKKWRTFVLKLKESNAKNVNVYFVKTDIKEAYDTIPHSKLQEVISKVLSPVTEEAYCIRCYAVLWMDSRGRIRRSFKRHSLSLKENSSKLLAFFQQRILNHVVRINDRYYMQCCGIPQGSTLSALLCSLCYGDMENKLLCGIPENGVFMWLIDDFLLVTPRLEQAKRFLRVLAAGIPEYGCTVRLDKTVVNFAIDDIPGLSSVQQLPAHSLFRWCGLLLDTQTLEVFCDYSSFSCTSIRSSVSFCHSSKASENLRHKVLNLLRLKCHGLFLDLQINSVRTVHINAYKILLLQAYRYGPEYGKDNNTIHKRFHACVSRLPFHQSIKNNPSFLLHVISDTASCFYMLLKEKNKGLTLGTKDAGGPFPFESAQWLNCHAFITKLSNHRLLYKRLLVPLHHCKAQLSRRIPNKTQGILQEVTDVTLHKDFSTIMD
ncbi:telomerase reverse transcriptase isoform X3 [Eleutherodactylus coqui]|uniref:telomerase reverse transcriptase isoform X3 n=1 Tax=Eleutherodactylus coqui TaxID=57060 RepID=UPI003462EA7B